MGYTDWSSDTYKNISATKSYDTKSDKEIFASSIDKDMNPMNLDVRESRDSDTHPESLAVCVFLDETGSMGKIPSLIVKEKLPALMNTIIDNGIPHPQILFGGIGDHISDDSPLQVGQFESGTEELDKWLTKIYLEGWGGGNNMESYLEAWLVAGRHTSIDCFEKRNEKGFLFTIGDEKSHGELSRETLTNLLGYKQAETVTDVQLLDEAQRLYHVYHIHINSTGYRNNSQVFDYWKNLLGERFIVLEDHNSVCETIATIIAMQHGVDMSTVTAKFDSKTAGDVSTALSTITKGDIVSTNNEGVIAL